MTRQGFKSLMDKLNPSARNEIPELLTKVASVIGLEAEPDPDEYRELENWVRLSPDRAEALLYITVTICHSHDVLPSALRQWAGTLREADIKQWKKFA